MEQDLLDPVALVCSGLLRNPYHIALGIGGFIQWSTIHHPMGLEREGRQGWGIERTWKELRRAALLT